MLKAKRKAKTVDPRIKQIMHDFNFKTVEQVMRLTDWKWVTARGENRIPTLREIRKTAREYLDRIVGYPNLSRCGTGGFMVEKYADGTIELRFELDTAQGFTED